MFVVLRPQDKYEKIMATVIDAKYMGGNTCYVVVEYEIDGIKYKKEFDAWSEYSVTEKILVRYKADNPQKIRPRLYMFYISMAFESIVIGVLSFSSLFVIKQRLRYKSNKEAKKDILIQRVFSISALAFTLLILILGGVSPVLYNSTKIFKNIESVVMFS